MHRRRVFAAKLALAVAGAAVAVGLGLQRFGLWDPSDVQAGALVLGAATVALVSTVAAAAAELRVQRDVARREQVGFYLQALGFAVQDAVGLDFRDLGLAAYLTRRSPLGRVRLERLHRVRPRTSPGVSGVRWRPGVGVIGRCVERGRDIGLDLGELDDELADVTVDGWRLLDEDTTLGLSYDEWERVRGAFGVVVATPIVDERRGRSVVAGCVALDGPTGWLGELFGDDVRALVQAAAASVAQVVL